ncbi:MAG TPA: hypothetical protein VIJ05_03465, partial [Actinomycetes bacterium]
DTRKAADVTRLFTLSIADLLEEFFSSPELQAVHAVSGVIGTWAGPRAPGTAYVMAHHHIGDVGDGHLGSWAFPEGGMGRWPTPSTARLSSSAPPCAPTPGWSGCWSPAAGPPGWSLRAARS